MNLNYEFVEFNSEIPYKSFIVGINEFSPHFHDEFEIVFVIKGRLNVSVSYENFQLNSKDFIVINSKEIHYFDKIGDENISMIIQISPKISILSYPLINLMRFKCNSVNLKENSNLIINDLRNELTNIAIEICKKQEHYELSIYSMILKILTMLFRNFYNYTVSDQDFRSGNDNLDRINTIFEYVKQNYSEDISLNSISAIMHLNNYYLSHFFTKNAGMPFGKYLSKIRIEKSEMQILASNKSITDIAMECGFSNVKTFYRYFKEFEGCTPSEYKSSNLHEDKNIKNYALDNGMSNKKVRVYKSQYSIVEEHSILSMLSPLPIYKSENDYSNEENPKYSISFNMDVKGISFKHYWRKLLCGGRAAEGLREDWRNQLREIQKDLKFEYIRFHGIFNEEMMIYHEVNGFQNFNWQYLDSLFDFLQEVHLKPLLEIGYMPLELSTGDKTIFWWKGNITPPKDYKKWANLVKQLILHCINRYGKDEVLKWYFEVWNEPNLIEFWDGRQKEYFILYQYTVNAIKDIDIRLKVGGPCTTLVTKKEVPWLNDFMDFCDKNCLSIDFISCHPYPADSKIDKEGAQCITYNETDITFTYLTLIRNMINKSSFKNVEIILTEWDSSFSSRDYVNDTAFKAPFIIKNILQSINLVDGLGYWSFTDIFEESRLDNRIFHGGFGLVNLQGLKKPSYYGYWFLSKLGTVKITSSDFYFITRKEDSIQILMWNYCHYKSDFAEGDRTNITEYSRYDVFIEKSIMEINLEITGIDGDYRVYEYRFDRNHGSVFDSWIKMGAPENLGKVEMDILKQKIGPEGEVYLLKNNNTFKRNVLLKPHGVCLIELLKI